MNIARSSLKLFSANVANAGIQFLGIVYFARELGATQMGIFFLFQVVLGLLAIPADFGLRGAVQKRVSEGDSRGGYLSSAVLLKLVPIAIIIFSILLARPYLDDYIGAAVTIPLIAALLLQEASMLSIAVLSGELRVGETAVLKVARNGTWVVIGSLLVQLGLQAEALIYGLVAGMAVVTIWGWQKVSVFPKMPSHSLARSLFDYSKYSVVSSVGGYLFSWTDVAVIGLFLSQAHVGAYEIAWRVTAVSLLFSKAIASTIFPQVSEWSEEGANERIEDLIRRTITPAIFFVIPVFFGILLLSEEILSIVFGTEYTIAAMALILLMGGKIFDAVQLILGKSLQAIDKPNLAARAAIVSISANISLNIIFVLRFGILGAALATVTSSILNDVLHYRYLRRYITVDFPKKEILECTLSALVMSAILYATFTIYAVETAQMLIISIFLGGSVYIGIVLLMPDLRYRLREALNRVGVLR